MNTGSQNAIVLLGEKDHGKSTIIGYLAATTGAVPSDRILSIRKIAEDKGSPFEYAHVIDSFVEEREKGMTIDTAHVRIRVGGKPFNFIDVPGHDELLKNRLVGATSAQCGILVIAADEGITTQTKKHIALAKFLEIKNVVVTVNKMDTVGYSKKKFQRIKTKVQLSLQRAAIQAKHIIPIVARTGCNINVRSRSMHWYRGPTLLQAVRELRVLKKGRREKVLVVVQGVYGDSIASTIVTGRLARGQRLRVYPQNEVTVLKSISGTGSMRTLTLSHGVKVKRGDVLTDSTTSPFRVRIRALCIVLGARTNKHLVVESCGKESVVLTMVIKKRGVLTQDTQFSLATPLSFGRNFVLKSGGKIIGLCRVQ